MSLWKRIANVFRREQVNAELDEEIRLHIEEAIDAGRDPGEVRRAFGAPLRKREESRDYKVATQLDSLRADLIFGWRLLLKHRTASATAILSLALTIGACTAAFRLVDSLLLRPLPVAAPERLYILAYEFVDQNGQKDIGDSFDYPLFRRLRAAVKDQAELIAISSAGRNGITFGSDDETERVYRQQVSGWMFSAFGLKPAAGRLFTHADDVQPGAHPYAVISYDYWTRRFGRSPQAVGRTYRMGKVYQIVGVAPEGFTGTETGTPADLFTPTMMNEQAIDSSKWSWFRTWVQLKPGVNPESVRQKLAATVGHARREQVKEWKEVPQTRIDQHIQAPVLLQSAAAGASGLQRKYRQSLFTLGALVLLLLLIACANVANLLLAQAATRTREMALRISIGAGRGRLVQLVLAESALLALVATGLGALFAWWSAPVVVSMINPPDHPVRLHLPADWRVLGFAAALCATVVFLFGLAPALRASSAQPMLALRGGEDPHTRRRWMFALVAAQVGFCLLVHFLAGLFVATFQRLSTQPTGFSSERLLTLETVAKSDQPPAAWDEVAQRLRTVPGVESVAMSGFPLMGGYAWVGGLRVPGGQWDAQPPYLLDVSPGWLATMRIALIGGRDLRADELTARVAVVNEAFAQRYFDGQNPVGRVFERSMKDGSVDIRIVGFVRNAMYSNPRESIRPTAYLPWGSLDDGNKLRQKNWATYVVKTSIAQPLALAPPLRREVARARSDFRVVSINTQQEFVDSHTIRERLLALLSMFFALVALVLAGVGLYGVLHYSVLQRRREIGIRLALGARAGHIARGVTREVFVMLVLGAAAGLAAGLSAERYVAPLLFQVKATDWPMLSIPVATILLAGLLAAVPPVWQAVRVDPASVLRSE